ncbi:IclR family transcriptional regulator [Oleiharenicola lentus]|uniref:IclR family transcriptional regulator n=1 Tax=Oleiharenicola lentus TaxID=2508720 RepID=UPI003F670F31
MSGNAPIQSLNRAAQILFAVAGAERGRTLTQISHATGLNPNTAYRLVRTLEGDNLLTRSTSPLRFHLGPVVEDLVRLESERHLLAVAAPVLSRHQLRLPGSNFSLVDRLPGAESCPRISVTAHRPGVAVVQRSVLHRPYEKASALLFLAYDSPEDQAEFFKKHPFERTGTAHWGNLTRLHGFLADVRRLGYAIPEFPDREFYRVAAPIFSTGNALIAAVGAYMETTASERDRFALVEACRATAREISRKLGEKSAAA